MTRSLRSIKLHLLPLDPLQKLLILAVVQHQIHMAAQSPLQILHHGEIGKETRQIAPVDPQIHVALGVGLSAGIGTKQPQIAHAIPHGYWDGLISDFLDGINHVTASFLSHFNTK